MDLQYLMLTCFEEHFCSLDDEEKNNMRKEFTNEEGVGLYEPVLQFVKDTLDMMCTSEVLIQACINSIDIDELRNDVANFIEHETN